VLRFKKGLGPDPNGGDRAKTCDYNSLHGFVTIAFKGVNDSVGRCVYR
jgi:hypothetical protein